MYTEDELNEMAKQLSELATGVYDISKKLAKSGERRIKTDAEFRDALFNVKPGDTIVLDADSVFQGPYWLPIRPAGKPITICSSTTLPNRRVLPTDKLATILPTESEPAIVCEGSSSWRLQGLRFGSNGPGTVIALQDADNIVMDQIVIIGGNDGQKRGIQGNGTNIALLRSYIANCWADGMDSQAFCAWDGAGPYEITDNYLEAAGENVMFGGADSTSPTNIPSNIYITNNHITKKPEWRLEGKTVKNLLEFKCARQVRVFNNLLENNWPSGQAGYALLITPRNQDGHAPWSIIEDVVIQNNRIQNTAGIFNFSGRDDEKVSEQTDNITVENNLCTGTGNFLLLGNELGSVTINHNTVDQGDNFGVIFSGDVMESTGRRPGKYAIRDLVMTNNLTNHGPYGFFGDGVGTGMPAFELIENYTWTHNVLAGGEGNVYPPLTLLPDMETYKLNFNDDYTLKANSPYKNAGTDDKDLGIIKED